MKNRKYIELTIGIEQLRNLSFEKWKFKAGCTKKVNVKHGYGYIIESNWIKYMAILVQNIISLNKWWKRRNKPEIPRTNKTLNGSRFQSMLQYIKTKLLDDKRTKNHPHLRQNAQLIELRAAEIKCINGRYGGQGLIDKHIAACSSMNRSRNHNHYLVAMGHPVSLNRIIVVQWKIVIARMPMKNSFETK